MSKSLKFFGFALFTLVALASLNSCASLKGGAKSDSAVGKLSLAIQQMDAKVPVFVQAVFNDPKAIKGVVKQHVDELQEPLTGFAAVMFTEWQTYSLKYAEVDNTKYKPFTMALPQANGPLSKRVCAAINTNFTKVLTQSRDAFKKCREAGEAEVCRKKFEEQVTKELSAIIAKVIEEYYLQRVKLL